MKKALFFFLAILFAATLALAARYKSTWLSVERDYVTDNVIEEPLPAEDEDEPYVWNSIGAYSDNAEPETDTDEVTLEDTSSWKNRLNELCEATYRAEFWSDEEIKRTIDELDSIRTSIPSTQIMREGYLHQAINCANIYKDQLKKNYRLKHPIENINS